MVDPIVLSSGQVMDRKTALEDNGKLKFTHCPMTRKRLSKKVYPLSFLKGHLRDWLINRFKNILLIAEEYKDQPEKFDRICELADLALKNLGEKKDLYKNEANQYA